MKYSEIEQAFAKAKEEKRKPNVFITSDFPKTLTEKLKTIEPIKVGDKYSADETFKNVKNAETQAALVLAGKYPRSWLANGKPVTSIAEYGSLTPLFMLAMKEEHGIQYEDWNKEDQFMGLALGSFLLPLLDEIPHFTTEEILEFRKYLIDEGYKPQNFKVKGLLGKIKYNMPQNFMLLQFWLANAAHRVPGNMILDPYDWDAVPEAFDAVPKAPKEETISKRREVKLPWE